MPSLSSSLPIIASHFFIIDVSRFDRSFSTSVLEAFNFLSSSLLVFPAIFGVVYGKSQRLVHKRELDCGCSSLDSHSGSAPSSLDSQRGRGSRSRVRCPAERILLCRPTVAVSRNFPTNTIISYAPKPGYQRPQKPSILVTVIIHVARASIVACMLVWDIQ
jgi:hypothetical protein